MAILPCAASPSAPPVTQAALDALVAAACSSDVVLLREAFLRTVLACTVDSPSFSPALAEPRAIADRLLGAWLSMRTLFLQGRDLQAFAKAFFFCPERFTRLMLAHSSFLLSPAVVQSAVQSADSFFMAGGLTLENVSRWMVCFLPTAGEMPPREAASAFKAVHMRLADFQAAAVAWWFDNHNNPDSMGRGILVGIHPNPGHRASLPPPHCPSLKQPPLSRSLIAALLVIGGVEQNPGMYSSATFSWLLNYLIASAEFIASRGRAGAQLPPPALRSTSGGPPLPFLASRHGEVESVFGDCAAALAHQPAFLEALALGLPWAHGGSYLAADVQERVAGFIGGLACYNRLVQWAVAEADAPSLPPEAHVGEALQARLSQRWDRCRRNFPFDAIALDPLRAPFCPSPDPETAALPQPAAAPQLPQQDPVVLAPFLARLELVGITAAQPSMSSPSPGLAHHVDFDDISTSLVSDARFQGLQGERPGAVPGCSACNYTQATPVVFQRLYALFPPGVASVPGERCFICRVRLGCSHSAGSQRLMMPCGHGVHAQCCYRRALFDQERHRDPSCRTCHEPFSFPSDLLGPPSEWSPSPPRSAMLDTPLFLGVPTQDCGIPLAPQDVVDCFAARFLAPEAPPPDDSVCCFCQDPMVCAHGVHQPMRTPCCNAWFHVQCGMKHIVVSVVRQVRQACPACRAGPFACPLPVCQKSFTLPFSVPLHMVDTYRQDWPTPSATCAACTLPLGCDCGASLRSIRSRCGVCQYHPGCLGRLMLREQNCDCGMSCLAHGDIHRFSVDLGGRDFCGMCNKSRRACICPDLHHEDLNPLVIGEAVREPSPEACDNCAQHHRTPASLPKFPSILGRVKRTSLARADVCRGCAVGLVCGCPDVEHPVRGGPAPVVRAIRNSCGKCFYHVGCLLDAARAYGRCHCGRVVWIPDDVRRFAMFRDRLHCGQCDQPAASCVCPDGAGLALPDNPLLLAAMPTLCTCSHASDRRGRHITACRMSAGCPDGLAHRAAMGHPVAERHSRYAVRQREAYAAAAADAAPPGASVLLSQSAATGFTQSQAVPHVGSVALLPDLRNLALHRGQYNCPDFIPKAARSAVSNCLGSILASLSSRDLQSWLRLMYFPACILHMPRKSRGQYTDLLVKRCRRWAAGECAALWDEFVVESNKISAERASREGASVAQAGAAPPSPAAVASWEELEVLCGHPAVRGVNLDEAVDADDLDPAVLKKSLRYVGVQQYSKAAACLGASKSAKDNSETMAQLRNLHPPEAEPDAMPRPALHNDYPQLTEMQVRYALKAFPPGSAAGPCGLSPQLLLQLLSCPTSTVPNHIARVVNIICGMDPHTTPHPDVMPFLYGATLFAKVKPDESIRPLACSCVWRRLAFKALAMAVKELAAKQLLVQHQVGVGVSSGPDLMAGTARRFAQMLFQTNDRLRCIVKLDFRNAFNLVYRRFMLETIRVLFPAVYGAALLAYGRHSFLVYRGEVILSQTGCQQGDPLATLFFSLVLSRVRSEVEMRHGGPADATLELESYFLDDGVVGGPGEVVLAFVNRLEELGQPFGLILNWSKCEFIALDPGLAAILGFDSRIRLRSIEDWSLLGVPCGTCPIASAVHARKVIDQAIAKSQCVVRIGDPHKAFILSRFTAGFALVNHVMRAVGFVSELECFDASMRANMERLVGRMSDVSWAQFSLPISLGGFGIRTCAPHATAAAVSAMLDSVSQAHLLADRDMLASPTAMLQPLLDRDPLYATSPTRDAVASYLLNVETRPGEPVPRKVQKTLGRAIEQHRLGVLLDTLRATDGAEGDVARIQLACSPNTGGWLVAVPDNANGDTRVLHQSPWLSPPEFTVACLLRLGLPVVAADHVCSVCRRLVADKFGEHSLNCMNGGERTRLSSCVVALVEELGRLAGMAGSTQCCPFASEPHARVDIALSRGNTTDLIDVAITNKDKANPTAYEAVKLRRYGALVALEALGRFRLISFVVGSTGKVSDSAMLLVGEIATGIAYRHSISTERAKSMVLQSLNVAVIRGVARVVIRNMYAAMDPEILTLQLATNATPAARALREAELRPRVLPSPLPEDGGADGHLARLADVCRLEAARTSATGARGDQPLQVAVPPGASRLSRQFAALAATVAVSPVPAPSSGMPLAAEVVVPPSTGHGAPGSRLLVVSPACGPEPHSDAPRALDRASLLGLRPFDRAEVVPEPAAMADPQYANCSSGGSSALGDPRSPASSGGSASPQPPRPAFADADDEAEMPLWEEPLLPAVPVLTPPRPSATDCGVGVAVAPVAPPVLVAAGSPEPPGGLAPGPAQSPPQPSLPAGLWPSLDELPASPPARRSVAAASAARPQQSGAHLSHPAAAASLPVPSEEVPLQGALAPDDTVVAAQASSVAGVVPNAAAGGRATRGRTAGRRRR